MAEILVLAEHDGETVKKVTTELLTLARAHGEPAVVWTGDGAEGACARLAEFGAAKVYVADSADYADNATSNPDGTCCLGSITTIGSGNNGRGRDRVDLGPEHQQPARQQPRHHHRLQPARAGGAEPDRGGGGLRRPQPRRPP